MQLNDPFGRMATKRQREYEVVRQSLQGSDVTTVEAGQALLNNIRQRGKWMILGAIPCALIPALLLPQFALAFIVTGVLFIAWTFSTTRNGLGYVQRYINEELQGATDDADRSDTTP
ncbi:hypothetical protein [Aestuariirhabdus litorea]|uniref:Uncharacterized protein n=1 Tax=Aestuariirhabdus litorea TaxID=2528527 RepID=A0A3P3VR27_9GAMM|nr:hypothetical protein [Aestuariirhabdus litorea]RRJ83979.1 hypothetical protein D0544_02340 [Aestuariirhabdus litorea]RWW97199.1 hypothetical protein DZC74_02335 [Endozoicomonadaceae bacterium GTF-13]